MSLKIKVFVGEINNLTDARYCAAMGVEALGFVLDGPQMVDVEKVAQISNWVSGIKRIGEFKYSHPSVINEVSMKLLLDNVLVYSDDYSIPQIATIEKSVILKVIYNSKTNLIDFEAYLNLYKNQVSLFLISLNFQELNKDYLALIAYLCKKFPIIISTQYSVTILTTIVSDVNPVGIYLKGESELRPGYKDFDSIGLLLETLDTD